MHTLLETLPEKIQQTAKKHLSFTELTKFSVMLNEHTALIGTNKKLMLVITKWLFFKKIHLIPWQDLIDVSQREKQPSFLSIKTKTQELRLPVAGDKQALLQALLQQIKASIKLKEN